MRTLVVLILFVLLFTSCVTAKYSSPKGVRLGMTKEEVVELVGKPCKLVNAIKTPEGLYETVEYIEYKKHINNKLFVYFFFNNKLTEWHTEVLK